MEHVTLSCLLSVQEHTILKVLAFAHPHRQHKYQSRQNVDVLAPIILYANFVIHYTLNFMLPCGPVNEISYRPGL